MAKKTNTEINGQKYYRISATIGVNSDGKRIRKYFYGESKKDAETKRDAYLAGIERGLCLDYDKITMGALFAQWFEEVLKPSIKENSYNRYEVDYRLRVKPSDIATMRLKDIKSIHLQKWYNSLYEEKGYNIVYNLNKLVRSFFIYCVNEDYIIKNPLKAVKLPKKPQKTDDDTLGKILSKNDIKKIKNLSTKHFIFLFALSTGLRQGEILALQHKDIDLEQQTISVTKTLSKELEFGSPKTLSSKRTVPIYDGILTKLKKHIIAEKEKHIKLGITFTEEAFLFSSVTCGPRYDRNVRRSWKRLCKRLDIEECQFKCLRATFCTLLAERNVPLKDVATLMGHSSTNTTAQYYTFVTEQQKRKSINVLNDVL